MLTAAAVLALASSPVSAQSIVLDNSSPVSVGGISQFQTDFNTLAGMSVAWTLTGGNGSAAWGDVSAASGITGAWGIWTSDFKLWGNGATDTFGTDVWNLWSMDLLSFSMDALAGNAVFDRISTHPANSTENSATGKEFNWNGTGPASRVTYSDPVGVTPNAAVGDLYGTLTVAFGSVQSPGCPSGWSSTNGGTQCRMWNWNTWSYSYQAMPAPIWVASAFGTSNKCDSRYSPTVNQSGSGDNTKCFAQFSQDMDNLAMDTGGGQEVVPEPATMTLLATGLAGMAAARRKRQNK